MATYQITKSDGSSGPAIPDAASPDTSTDLQLVGQNAVSYGLDVATSFFWLLESFANTAPPVSGSNRNTGQVWYNTTATIRALNVYNGATWDQVANHNVGTVTGATSWWDDTAGQKKWKEDVLIRVDGSGTLTLAGPATGTVGIINDNTDLNITGTATTTGITVDGTITAVQLPSLTLTTELDEIYGGTGVTSYAQGDILYASAADTLVALNAGTNGQVLTMGATVPGWVSGAAGVSALDDLSDVTLTTPANNSLLYRSTGQYIDSDIAALSFDGTNLSATQIGGIVEGQLVDKNATETIAGAWTFSNVQPITATAGDIDATNGFGFVTTDGATAGAIRADNGTGQIQFTHSNTPDWDIDGLGLVLAHCPIYATSVSSAASFRSIGDIAGWSGTDSFISFYDKGMSVHGMQIGTTAASSSAGIVNARSGDLELSASNTLVLDLRATNPSTMYENSNAAMQWRAVTGTDISTTASVYDSVGSTPRNVGFNETPTNSITSSRNIGIGDIGKFLTRTTLTARTLTVVNDTAIPIGGSCVVHNGHASNSLSISPGALTLHWVDGSGSLPGSATRTIAYNSVVTLRKVSSTVWQIWGNGIS